SPPQNRSSAAANSPNTGSPAGAPPRLNQQLGLVNLLDELRSELLLLLHIVGGLVAISGGDFGEAVALILRQGDGAGESGSRFRLDGLVTELDTRWRLTS
ncbi:hypothetical protein CRG98_016642, partial [Punica granatum]